jgi:hypothetical protein
LAGHQNAFSMPPWPVVPAAPPVDGAVRSAQRRREGQTANALPPAIA